MHTNRELQGFLEQAISEDKSSSIEAWLDQDPSHWKRLEELADDPQLIARLRRTLPAAIYQDEPELQRALAEMTTKFPSDSPTVSAPLSKAEESADPTEVRLAGYRIIRKLGSGGMGAVYEAEHELMRKRVAVKVMSRRFLEDATAAERFLSEMVAIGKLNHPNLVRGLDARREGERLYLIMEYLEAEDLAAYRNRTGPLPLEVSCDIIRQAASGLAHAHDQGIIHRDIKPTNLMINAEGDVKVLDLGLARLESAQNTGHLTSDEVILGTPDYISPEQVQTPRDVDARADLYSLGCTLFFLLTGRSPFHHYEKAMPKLLAHVNESPTLPEDIREKLPESLVQFLTKLTEKDRSLRFQTAQDVLEAIAPFCDLSNENAVLRTDSGTLAQDANELKDIACPSASRGSRFNSRRAWWIAIIPIALALAFGITLFVKSPYGTIQIKFADSSQLAAIDVTKKDVVTIKDPNDNENVVISVDRKKRTLRIRKRGFEVLTKDFQMNVKGQKIEVAFTPIEPPEAKHPKASAPSVVTPESSNAADSAPPNGIAIAYGGGWVIDGEEIVQTKTGIRRQLLRFGDSTWSEYDFSFEGRVPDQNRVHGFSGMFHLTSPADYMAFGVGIYYNKGHEVSRAIDGKWNRKRGMYTPGTIEAEKWHKVRIKVRGTTAYCFLDEQMLFVSNEPLFESGQCGLATYDTRARFRNLRVETPDGVVLWDGLPTSIENSAR